MTELSLQKELGQLILGVTQLVGLTQRAQHTQTQQSCPKMPWQTEHLADICPSGLQAHPWEEGPCLLVKVPWNVLKKLITNRPQRKHHQMFSDSYSSGMFQTQGLINKIGNTERIPPNLEVEQLKHTHTQTSS